jgi:hypothetical protein
MTERERLIKVLRKETPDRVPWFADLGHWYRSETGTEWNLFTISNLTKEMTDLHKEVKAGWYIEVGSLCEEYYEEGVTRERYIVNKSAIECFHTPIGDISMERKWNPISYSWDVIQRMVNSTEDLRILMHAIERRHYVPRYENWDLIEEIGGDVGLGFPSLGYTGLGSLISYYMGVQNTIYAIYDEPELIGDYIRMYNGKQLELADIYCGSPAPHLFFGDNLSNDIQPPELFKKYSFGHYKNIADRFHNAGKTVSAHLDGRLRNIIGLVAKAGIDVADACTPAPAGDLEPSEIRRQAGNDIILFGGISPDMWLPETSEKDFIDHVKKWLDLRKVSSNLVQSAGDQVPPGTKLERIKLVYEIVEEYGRYDF